MFGQSTSVSSTSSSDNGNRMYRIEVQGMGQRVDPDRISYRIRSTGTTYLSVPYNRLSEQMQRINRMGGKILSIEPLGGEPSDNHDARQQATANFQSLRHTGTNSSGHAADEE